MSVTIIYEILCIDDLAKALYINWNERPSREGQIRINVRFLGEDSMSITINWDYFQGRLSYGGYIDATSVGPRFLHFHDCIYKLWREILNITRQPWICLKPSSVPSPEPEELEPTDA